MGIRLNRPNCRTVDVVVGRVVDSVVSVAVAVAVALMVVALAEVVLVVMFTGEVVTVVLRSSVEDGVVVIMATGVAGVVGTVIVGISPMASSLFDGWMKVGTATFFLPSKRAAPAWAAILTMGSAGLVRRRKSASCRLVDGVVELVVDSVVTVVLVASVEVVPLVA